MSENLRKKILLDQSRASSNQLESSVTPSPKNHCRLKLFFEVPKPFSSTTVIEVPTQRAFLCALNACPPHYTSSVKNNARTVLVVKACADICAAHLLRLFLHRFSKIYFLVFYCYEFSAISAFFGWFVRHIFVLRYQTDGIWRSRAR